MLFQRHFWLPHAIQKMLLGFLLEVASYRLFEVMQLQWATECKLLGNIFKLLGNKFTFRMIVFFCLPVCSITGGHLMFRRTLNVEYDVTFMVDITVSYRHNASHCMILVLVVYLDALLSLDIYLSKCCFRLYVLRSTEHQQLGSLGCNNWRIMRLFFGDALLCE